MLEADILERIDRRIRELEAIRAALVASTPAANGGGSEGADDQAPRGWSPRWRPSGRLVASAFTASR